MVEVYIAHVRKADDKKQSLREHLEGVADLSRNFSSKQGLGLSGELIGLLHDFGKYSEKFQNYLKSATGLLNPDDDEDFVDAKGLKGKIDHSTAGAQLTWRELSKQGPLGQIVGQIFALCIASHHSGLIDCLTSDPTKPVSDNFTRRMGKLEDKAHLEEAFRKADSAVLERFQSILVDQDLIHNLKKSIHSIISSSPNFNHQDKLGLNDTVAQFQIGLLVRFLFSCLIDSDRINSADFEKPNAASHRMNGQYTGWEELIQRLESHLSTFTPKHQIDSLRNDISRHCLEAAVRSKGVYTLTVPTGGGKTLASLRFALHHAKNYGLERVVYVIPFTSIIDQNADVTRKILEPVADRGRVVLEHHSNLTPETQGWREKMLTDNWDAPIVYTTSVQFLEALFGAGTRGARRMHQLANAVIVFDEIQTLPVKCVHIFNNAINFLVEQCGSTVILCTATQPLLAKVDTTKGAIRLTENSEIMPDVQELFEKLKRVEIKDDRRPGGWSEEAVADLAIQAAAGDARSCLVIVNTKKAARGLYRRIESRTTTALCHLSTSMCPVHRREVLKMVRESLDRKDSILCISTQLIEAGVDVDFGSVIRFAAGLDSIAQAAGRCNRNGGHEKGIVHIINPADENLNSLEDIRIGREKAERVLEDFRQNPSIYDDNLLGKKAMDCYYQNYFYSRKDQMDYPVPANLVGRDDTILNLLSVNSMAVSDYKRSQKKVPDTYLRQSFMAAAKAFQAIDAPTQSVIVQYGREGKACVAGLCDAFDVEKQSNLLRRAQQYTVNVFPHEFQKLMDKGALFEVQQGTEIYYLDNRYYSKDFGLAVEPVSDEEFLHV